MRVNCYQCHLSAFIFYGEKNLGMEICLAISRDNLVESVERSFENVLNYVIYKQFRQKEYILTLTFVLNKRWSIYCQKE